MANIDYKNTAPAAQFTPMAEIYEAVDYLDRVIILGYSNFPRTDSLRVGMAALCGDEFMGVTAIGPGSVAVSRGVADTVPAKHAAHALIWFIDNSVVGNDRKEHVAGETNSVKYSPITIGGGNMNIADSDIDVVNYNWRFFRPYPPGQLLVRGERWYVQQTLAADDPNMKLTWAHRDRTIEADQLVDHDVTNIGPEPGTSYTVRVYDSGDVLKRTETGIMATTHDMYGNLIPPSWTYTWQQAMTDLEAVTSPELGDVIGGHLTIYATRNGFDSWQGYEIPFTVNTQGQFIKVAQLGELAAQPSNPEDSEAYPPASGIYGAQVAQTLAQPMTDEDNAPVAADGLYVAQVREGAGQATSFYTPLSRNLFEAPYAYLVKRQDDRSAAKLITVAARPSDRLTDAHSIWTRYDYPQGIGDSFQYTRKIEPVFTPWITLDASLEYLDTNAIIGKSSFYDGVSLGNVQVGQVALIDAEIVRIDAKAPNNITLARGCYDTVPTRHARGARLWFFEAMAGNDPTTYPLTLSANNVLGAAAQVKMVPTVYGPPLDLDDVPTDRLIMDRRVERPYPPGQVRVNGQPWFNGRVMQPNENTLITWVHRNRDTQGANVVDHLGPDRAPEDQQKYRLSIAITIRPISGAAYTVTIRNEIVEGTEFQYTYSMAQMDGYRAGQLLGACGRVTVGMVLESVRGEFKSWQNYVIPLALPSYACPAGQQPGGGQLPPNTGGGNGDTGGPDDVGDDPTPSDNDSGDDGSGPPPQPEVPPDWPDPINPPPEPDPDDPNPALAAHWDTNWDRHWDAYTKDDIGT